MAKKQNTIRKSKQPKAVAWRDSQLGRALIILGVTLALSASVLAYGVLHAPSLHTRTYKYQNGGINFSFDYPADFSKQNIQNPNNYAYTVQQCRQDPDGAIIGCFSAAYENYTALLPSDVSLIRHTISGDQSLIPQFNEQSTNQGNCTTHTYVTTASNKPLLQCGLADYLAHLSTDSYKIEGISVFAAGAKGLYTFQFEARSTYWDAHKVAWPDLVKAIDYE